MEDLSQIIDTVRLPLEIQIPDYLRDHHVREKAVLPAVAGVMRRLLLPALLPLLVAVLCLLPVLQQGKVRLTTRSRKPIASP